MSAIPDSDDRRALDARVDGEWLHYSSEPIASLDRNRRYDEQARADKPAGFWLSSGDDWRRWREAEQWGIPEADYVYRVGFSADARLLVVGGDEIPRLHKRFPHGRIDEVMPFYPSYEHYPSWERIAEQFDGVLIPKYAWNHRHSVRWYYCWDCGSGCIWNLAAISSLEHVATLAVCASTSPETASHPGNRE